MAVLHITYESNSDNNNGAYEEFCNLLKSYQSIRLLNPIGLSIQMSRQKLSGRSSSAILSRMITS